MSATGRAAGPGGKRAYNAAPSGCTRRHRRLRLRPRPRNLRERRWCASHADNLPPQGGLPATVRVEPQSRELPVAVLGMIGQDPPGDFPGHAARQVEHEVGILCHRSSLCVTGELVQSGLSKRTGGLREHCGPGGKLQHWDTGHQSGRRVGRLRVGCGSLQGVRVAYSGPRDVKVEKWQQGPAGPRPP